MRNVAIAIATLVLSGSAPAAVAPFYLVGAQLYSCDSTGTNGGPGTFADYYQYSTNSATTHNPLDVNGDGSAIAFLLDDGANPFTFTTGGFDPGDYACLNLFFDDMLVSFNPPYDANQPIPGDLTVIAPVDGDGFAFPVAGINVQSYNSSNFSVVATSYSGATAISIEGGPSITVTEFSVSPSIAGTFTIHVPEPGAGAAAIAQALALGLLARRR